jgi:hypothetical protein
LDRPKNWSLHGGEDKFLFLLGTEGWSSSFHSFTLFFSVLFDAALIYQYYVISEIDEGMWDIDRIILTGGGRGGPKVLFPLQTPHSLA